MPAPLCCRLQTVPAAPPRRLPAAEVAGRVMGEASAYLWIDANETAVVTGPDSCNPKRERPAAAAQGAGHARARQGGRLLPRCCCGLAL